jgi:hypothetical protein
MPTGILGQSSLTAATNTSVYTVPATKTATFNVSIVNATSGYSLVRLAVAGSGTPANSEFLEYDTILAPKAVLERGGLVAQAGEIVVAYSDTANVSVSVYGYEE